MCIFSRMPFYPIFQHLSKCFLKKINPPNRKRRMRRLSSRPTASMVVIREDLGVIL
jgi:hypothetical protein